MIRILIAALAVLLSATTVRAEQITGLGGQCLDVAGGGTGDGRPAWLWRCTDNSVNQRWWLLDGHIVGSGGKCLDVMPGRPLDGAPIRMWTCKPDSPNQNWTLRDGQLVGIGGKCMDAEGGRSANGTRIILWPCTGAPNQRWSVLPSVISR